MRCLSARVAVPRAACAAPRGAPRPSAPSVPGRRPAPPPRAAAGGGGAASDVRDALSGLSGVVTDAAVPEAHRGLHASLYGDGGAEAHAADAAYSARAGEDDGETVLPLADWLAAREGAAPTGVYAVFDEQRKLQLVSYSRNVVLALRSHLAQAGPARAAWVRVMVFANKAMCSRANLESQAAAWLRASGDTLPPGNGPEAALWGAPAAAVAEDAMTPAERAAFEDKKLKMKKAMGVKDKSTQAAEDAARLAEGDASESAAERRAQTILAMEAGDWSAVIDGQTRDATGMSGLAAAAGGAPKSSAPGAAPYVVSPFTRTSVHRAVGEAAAGAPARAMTMESVDAALNDVRPYLIADGGNVEVASVVGGVVALRLQGACGTCSSSAATMKMGIERALKNAFGDALKEVIQLGAPPGGVATDAAAITTHLEVLAPAIKAYGGIVVVKKLQAGVCVIGFRGPAPLGQGIAAAVRDKFPDIREVLLEEP